LGDWYALRWGGFRPAVYGFFHSMPLDNGGEGLRIDLERIVRTGAAALLTMQPWNGLGAVQSSDAYMLAEICRQYELSGGAGCLVRFAHEMNGHWYPWAMQPEAFVAKFRLISTVLRQATKRSGAVWAPHDNHGYPFLVPLRLRERDDSTSLKLLLDTDGDGQVTGRDDAYAPYYPGDDYVDWVSLTAYHWGRQWPWWNHTLPPAGAFLHAVSGFYEKYSADGGGHTKPFMVAETAAMYNADLCAEIDPRHANPSCHLSELRVKRAWWRQIFHHAVPRLPALRAVLWFDMLRSESELGGARSSWSLSFPAATAEAFVSDIMPRPGQHSRLVGVNIWGATGSSG